MWLGVGLSSLPQCQANFELWVQVLDRQCPSLNRIYTQIYYSNVPLKTGFTLKSTIPAKYLNSNIGRAILLGLICFIISTL